MEEHVVKIESDMEHVRSTLAEVKSDIKSLRGETASLRGETTALKAAMEKGVGELRTSIEKTKVWILVTGIGAVFALCTAAAAMHSLKLI